MIKKNQSPLFPVLLPPFSHQIIESLKNPERQLPLVGAPGYGTGLIGVPLKTKAVFTRWYRWWLKSGVHQLRLVVYPSICKVFTIQVMQIFWFPHEYLYIYIYIYIYSSAHVFPRVSASLKKSLNPSQSNMPMGGWHAVRPWGDVDIYPPKFNSSPLKNGGWKTILSYWGFSVQ